MGTFSRFIFLSIKMLIIDISKRYKIYKFSQENNKLAVEREKIAASKQIADTKLQIARENKNKYDIKNNKDKK